MRRYIYLFTAVILALGTVSCQDRLGIIEEYDFEITAMPVPSKVAKGEDVEIRMQILSEDQWVKTRYYLRYFSYEGKGILLSENGIQILPNEEYEIQENTFRLKYRPLQESTHNFRIWIRNRNDREQSLEFRVGMVE